MSLLEKSSSIEISRRSQPFYSKKGTYSAGQQVQIEVDVQREFIDFENSRLIFDCNYTKGSENFSIPSWAASSLIKNLRVKTLAGSMIGHEIREYRAYARMVKELLMNNDNSEQNTAEDLMEGAVSLTGQSANLSTQYAHKFLSHIFTVKEYYPAHFHQGIMIEFDLSPNNEVTWAATTNSAAANASYEISDVKFVADLVQLKPEIETELVKMMEEQRLFVDYIETLTQENTVSAGSGENFDIVGIDGRVKSIFGYQLLKGLNDTARTSHSTTFWPAKTQNGLVKYRYKLGANYLNYESIESDATNNKNREQIYELVKALDEHYSDKYRGFGSENHVMDGTQDFVYAVKVDKAQKRTDDIISSMIDKDRNNIRVELNTITSEADAITHIKLDKRLQILSGSIIRNIRS